MDVNHPKSGLPHLPHSPTQDLAHVAFFLAYFQPVSRDNVWAYF